MELRKHAPIKQPEDFVRVSADRETPSSKYPLLTFANLLCGVLCAAYCFLFWYDLKDLWFHPGWTTDDALQQAFIFHEVHSPGVFTGDLIAETMTGYLAPLHYWICYLGTWLSGDPIMMGHWVMTLQIALTLGFLFLAVRALSATAPALLAVLWFVHTRPIMQRITSGLPRGWAPVVILATMYFLIKRNHRAVLISLLCGCLLHPPATFLAAAGYGLFLTFGLLRTSSRSEYLKPFVTLALLSPLYLAVTLYVVHRPEEVGSMVSMEEARQLPEFQWPNGRFPFVPLRPVTEELRFFSYQPFGHRLHNPGRTIKRIIPFAVIGLFGLLLFIGAKRRRKVLPGELSIFLLATTVVYFLSRPLAFKLYVPNRHLQFPMSVVLITIFSVAVWRAFYSGKNSYADTSLRKSWQSLVAFLALGIFVFIGTGDGLVGAANFNYSQDKKGGVFLWTRKETPKEALMAGHPTHIDGMMLFGQRRAYATTETAHPFYQGYFKEVKRRIEISLRAHYARDLKEVAAILEPDNIDYFVFSRKRFYPEALEKEKYFEPLKGLVDELTSRDYRDYAYKKLPREVDLINHPYMPFRDDQSVVIDVRKLRDYLGASSKQQELNAA